MSTKENAVKNLVEIMCKDSDGNYNPYLINPYHIVMMERAYQLTGEVMAIIRMSNERTLSSAMSWDDACELFCMDEEADV